MARVRLDRFEDTVAVVVLDGAPFDLPRALLPSEAREGDLLNIQIMIEREASGAGRDAVAMKRSRVGRDDDGGDFSL